MALTRPAVKEILSKAGVAAENMDEAVKEIIAGHTATVDALKEKIENADSNIAAVEKLKNDIEKYKSDLEAAKQTIAENKKYKEMYESEKTAYQSYRNDITAKETKAAKEKAVKEFFRSKGISDDNMNIAMRGIKSEIEAAELDEKGKIKDIKAFDELIKGDYSKLISKTETRGAETQTPPPNTGKVSITKEEIMNIKNTAERQQKIAENPELFGLPPMKG